MYLNQTLPLLMLFFSFLLPISHPLLLLSLLPSFFSLSDFFVSSLYPYSIKIFRINLIHESHFTHTTLFVPKRSSQISSSRVSQISQNEQLALSPIYLFSLLQLLTPLQFLILVRTSLSFLVFTFYFWL